MYSVVNKGKIPKLAVKRYFNFKPDVRLYNKISTIVEYLIEYPEDLKFKRTKERLIEVAPLYNLKQMKDRLNAERINEKQMQEMVELQEQNNIPVMSPAEAFDYDLNTENGVFSCSENEAMEQGREFLFEWLCYKYKLEGMEKANCWANPEAYLSA